MLFYITYNNDKSSKKSNKSIFIIILSWNYSIYLNIFNIYNIKEILFIINKDIIKLLKII